MKKQTLTKLFPLKYQLPALLMMNVSNCSIAQELDSIVKPNINRAFEILAKNRTIYNQYNDSIFNFHEHDAWTNFFMRRSIKNHRLFDTNKRILNDIFEYFSMLERTHQFVNKDYEELYQTYRSMMQKKKTDHFITLKVCDILEGYYDSGNCPDSLNHTLYNHLWRAHSNNYIYSLTNDDSSLIRKTFNDIMYVYNNHNQQLADYKMAKFNALYDLLLAKWIQLGYLTLDQSSKIKEELAALINEPESEKILPHNYVIAAKVKIDTYEEDIIRNVFLTNSTIIEKSKGDSIVKAYIKKSLNTPKLSINSLYRIQLMRVLIHEATAKEGLLETLKIYQKNKDTQQRKIRFNDELLRLYLSQYMTLLYLNDIAEISEKEKRKNVKMFCHDIIAAYNRRLDQQYTPSYITQLHLLTTYPRLTKYLTEKERIDFLNHLNVATQVNTYAHTVHVGKLANIIMDGIIKYNPSLLLGTFGKNTVKEVKNFHKKYNHFIYHAALCHDLGKNSIISIVNNDYRPLTDVEYNIIKKHPKYGLEYLKITPILEKYHDTTLGHHKWYNGQGGYPEWFDNTKSPIRIMIDIITFCDCMQAATERLGRNYKQEKTFEMVMAELRKDAGTKYNPDLVDLVDKHKSIRQKLSKLVADGWLEIYYDIYRKYFK